MTSCLYLVMIQQFPNHCKAFPDQKPAAGVAVPKVMKAHVRDPITAAIDVP